ncbi:MAG: hypothetical protein M0Z54_06050 [Thermaerobacter sp.]|nr:hypothetical protein [Thermaerobacter sp.]
MKTLYLRNVPDEVVQNLERLAARAGISVSAAAVRELGILAPRAHNADIVAGLPDLEIELSTLVEAVRAGRPDA